MHSSIIANIQKQAKETRHVLLVNALSAIAYIALFRMIYETFLHPLFGYMGYSLHVNTEYETALTNFLAFFPILLFRAKKLPSDFIAIIIYIAIYIPTIVSLQYIYREYDSIIIYQIAFFYAQILFFMAAWNKKGAERYETNTDAIPFKYVIYAGVVIILIIVAFYGGRLRLVSFADVYSLRGTNDKYMEGHSFIGYLQSWASNLLSPLFIAYGCHKKQYHITLLGFACAIVVYMATGLKSAILMPFATVTFFYILSSKKMVTIKYLMPLISLFLLIFYFIGAMSKSKIIYMAICILFMRTIGVTGWLAPGYIEVFTHHPYTYYSHIGIINYFTGMYPFQNPSLGNAVWIAYTGNASHVNANANFLLTDGIAAIGLPGVFLIATIFYFILVYTNKVANNHAPEFSITMLIGTIVTVTNVSLFTTLLTGGLFFALILLRYSQTRNTNNKIGAMQ